MLLISVTLLFGVIASLGLGITVFLTNRSRKVNQAYLITSIFIPLWLSANLVILYSQTALSAIIAINTATAISACIPSCFQLLRLSIIYTNASWLEILHRTRIQLFLNFVIVALCGLPSFTQSVSFPGVDEGATLVQPQYGAPFTLFVLYLLGSIFVLGYNLVQDRRRLDGMQRLELDYLGFACLAGSVVAILGAIITLITKSSSVVPISNAACVLAISLLVAYGVSVHRILAVAYILRKITFYGLLSIFLTAVYLICWGVLSFPFKGQGHGVHLPIHILCTLIVVFSFSRVRQRMQRIADRLIATQSADIPLVMKAFGGIFESVTTNEALLVSFATLLTKHFSTTHASIFILEGTSFSPAFSTLPDIREPIAATSAMPTLINTTREPLCLESLERSRRKDLIVNATLQLNEFSTNMAVGVFSKGRQAALVLLGAREDRKLYDKLEQDALQILCNQFGVALENARLYTEMQNSKIRNEIMLDQLVNGVVVATPDHTISLFNGEAQRITGIAESGAISKPIDVLPPPLAQALRTALEEQSGVRNADVLLEGGEDGSGSKSIRLGTAFLRGHDETPMGALLVFTDTTELKGLEEQVRRTDQLSSVGTLAAGMAHEIKNPLVTIKTFTQLLPLRYADEEFRNDFSSLVAQEVSRIDGIVNELLSFSKPTKPHLVPMALHDTIQQTLKLAHEQMIQKGITLKQDFRATSGRISGDTKLLSQTLVNLCLNAIEAIDEGGTITVGTINCTYRFANAGNPGQAANPCIRIQISDTGKGIEEDQLAKIFDPFFTLKPEGTGMGLSVAHGIIKEHHGAIEVESQTGRGTTFFVYLPVLTEESAV